MQYKEVRIVRCATDVNKATIALHECDATIRHLSNSKQHDRLRAWEQYRAHIVHWMHNPSAGRHLGKPPVRDGLHDRPAQPYRRSPMYQGLGRICAPQYRPPPTQEIEYDGGGGVLADDDGEDNNDVWIQPPEQEQEPEQQQHEEDYYDNDEDPSEDFESKSSIKATAVVDWSSLVSGAYT